MQVCPLFCLCIVVGHEGCDGLSLLGDRFPKPEPPRKKVLVHGDGGADTMKSGFRLHPNPMTAVRGACYDMCVCVRVC